MGAGRCEPVRPSQKRETSDVLTKRAADIGVATILLAIGIAQFTGGLTLDRLENRNIHPWSFPGLVPIYPRRGDGGNGADGHRRAIARAPRGE
jgi:hypothetical protein